MDKDREIKELKDKLVKLESKVNELYEWMSQRKRQFVPDPLDPISKKILEKDFMRIVGSGVMAQVLSSSEFPFGYVKTVLKNKEKIIQFRDDVKRCLVDASTDIITANSHGLVNNDTVIFYTTEELPAGIDTFTTFYVVSATATTFKVSLTQGGSAIDITTNGKGEQYFSRG